jgi:poly(glycerol-phosphate) alpha-glucosyltransferase
MSRNAGGLQQSVRRLQQCLAQIPGNEVSVAALRDEFSDSDAPLWDPLKVSLSRVVGPASLGYAPDMLRQLLAAQADLVHRHGIWQHPSAQVYRWHKKTGRPYLISPHGMLDPWAVKNSAWKKRLVLALYEREHFQHVACWRALCESEAQSIRAFGLKQPIAIIPNAIDLEAHETARCAPDLGPGKPGRPKTLLYLGRLHPKKGLLHLLRAWAAVQPSVQKAGGGWILAIAGWDQGGYEAELQQLATQLGLVWSDVRGGSPAGAKPETTVRPPGSVLFLGPQFNEAKTACYQNCDAFILPSFSEGLPMVVLEAWAHSKPVLITPECNLPEGFAAGAAIRIEATADSTAQGLEQLCRMSAADLVALGTAGRDLVAARFTWPKVSQDLHVLYEWVLGGGSKPGFVV